MNDAHRIRSFTKEDFAELNENSDMNITDFYGGDIQVILPLTVKAKDIMCKEFCNLVDAASADSRSKHLSLDVEFQLIYGRLSSLAHIALADSEEMRIITPAGDYIAGDITLSFEERNIVAEIVGNMLVRRCLSRITRVKCYKGIIPEVWNA